MKLSKVNNDSPGKGNFLVMIALISLFAGGFSSVISDVRSGDRPDPSAPKIVDLSYGPAVVATGNSFAVSLRASDPDGIDLITFKAFPVEGWWWPCEEVTSFNLVNGSVYDGTWQVECPIPPDTPDQVYSFQYVCVDTVGSSTYETIVDGFGVSGGPEADHNAPVIVDISCAESVAAGTMLDVYVTISDESGVDCALSYVNVHQSDGNYIACSSDTFVPESGSPAEKQVYRASCLVPSSAPNGEYYLEVHVYDSQKNPAQQNVDNAFEVIGGATPDSVPPSISDLTYADSSVEWGETLSVTVSVSDLQSGIDHVEFQAKEPYSQVDLCRGPMALQSGDVQSGVWTFSCEVPVNSMIASYTGYVYAYDMQNNKGMTSKGFKVEYPTEIFHQ